MAKERKEVFECVTLSREDFEKRGFSTDKLDDIKMQRISQKIGEALISEMYWDLVDYYGSTFCESK
jgi:hypothetical protein